MVRGLKYIQVFCKHTNTNNGNSRNTAILQEIICCEHSRASLATTSCIAMHRMFGHFDYRRFKYKSTK